jgi:RHS repeat-associated protein
VRYQPSGAVSSYATGLGTGKNVTTTVLQDASLLARPAQIYAAQPSGFRLFDTQGYVYDGAGNIKTIGSDAFVYDNRSRLTSATYSGAGSQGYSYDRYGNLLSKAGVAFCTGSCTNNRLPTASGYSYDSRGNLTAKPGGETYAYDGLDRQIRHTAAGSSWNYVFDGSNERVVKVPPAGGAWTYTLRDEGNRVATEYSGATQSRDNMFLGNLAVVSYANSAVAGNGPVWTFYSSDHLGTPRLVTDIAGATVETRKSWPYGEDVGTPGTYQKLRFALMERDTEASRYYDHARSHDFGLGRFLSPDVVGGTPRDPQSWNRYAYVGNSPLKFTDPNGRERITFTILTRIAAPSVTALNVRPPSVRQYTGGLKTFQRFTIETDPAKATRPVLPGQFRDTGSTQRIDGAGKPIGDPGKASASQIVAFGSRDAAGNAVVTASASVGNPLNTPNPPITYNFTITADPSGKSFSLGGVYGGFPTAAIAATNEQGQTIPVYSFNEGDATLGPISLYPKIGDQQINRECSFGIGAGCQPGVSESLR